jgi:two-component system OmpR family response regulator
VRVRLETDGFAVLTANWGDEALKVLEENRPDHVILNLMMPDLDGAVWYRRPPRR